MQRIARYFVLVLGMILVPKALHAETGRQSFESCGLITGEYVTVLQLISRGFSPESLKQTLPDISEKAKKRIDGLAAMASQNGLIDSYSSIYSEYASCSKRVYDGSGIPPPGSREAHFHQCAGKTKIGYEITVAALIGADEADVVNQLQPSLQPKAKALFAEYQSGGRLSLFDTVATDLKHCLAAVP